MLTNTIIEICSTRLTTALRLQHPSKHQLEKVIERYFFGLNSSAAISNVTARCDTCNSLKLIPTEILEQSSSLSPTKPGGQFAADVLRRAKQRIFVARDTFSSFTTALLISDGKASSLRSALISSTSFLRNRTCVIRVDNTPGFLPLKDDKILRHQGIILDFGRVKNPNKNSVIEAIQEFDMIRMVTASPMISLILLSAPQNVRIRNRGLYLS